MYKKIVTYTLFLILITSQHVLSDDSKQSACLRPRASLMPASPESNDFPSIVIGEATDGKSQFSLPDRAKQVLESTENDGARVRLLRELFNKLYGTELVDSIATAHGRDNAQGEHVDYPDVQFQENEKAPEKEKVHLYSMGSTIQNSFIMLGRKRDDTTIKITQADDGEMFEFNLSDLEKLQEIAKKERKGDVPADERKIPAWANHTLGVLRQALKQKENLAGMDILLASNVPYGGGLSNSAANCLAVTMGLNEMYNWKMSKMDMVTLARDGEHDDFVGGACGWLDQLLIMFSKPGYFTTIDYGMIHTKNPDKIIRHFKSNLPPTTQRVLIDTNIPRVLAVTEYNDRVEELRFVFDLLKELLRRKHIGSTSLTLAEINDLIRIFSGLGYEAAVPAVTLKEAGVEDMLSSEEERRQNTNNLPSWTELLSRFDKMGYRKPDIFRHYGLSRRQSFVLLLHRMRHQLTSGLRTPLTGKAAEEGNVEAFYRLIDAEGRSLRMSGDFEITGDNGAQDALLDIGLGVAKELGIKACGRMEGGGGGGNVGFYVDRTNEELYQQWKTRTTAEYEKWVGSQKNLRDKDIKPHIIEPVSSKGAKALQKRALITGGAGYTGGELARTLLVQGVDVWIIDDESTGHKAAVPSEIIRKDRYIKGSICDTKLLKDIIEKNDIDVVYHLAAKALMEESVEKPALYYWINVIGTMAVAEAVKEVQESNPERNIIIANYSTCGVYDDDAKEIEEGKGLTEESSVRPTAPYTESKLLAEAVLEAYRKKHGIKYITIRPFNIVGASEDGQYGEDTGHATHLITVAGKAVTGELSSIKIFRNYNTSTVSDDAKVIDPNLLEKLGIEKDDSGIREYIHVIDMCLLTTCAADFLKGCLLSGEEVEEGADIFNGGTGIPFSTLKVIMEYVFPQAVELGMRPDWPKIEIAGTRPGDDAVKMSDMSRADKFLNWQPQRSIAEVVGSHLIFLKKRPKGYEDDKSGYADEAEEKALMHIIEALEGSDIIEDDLKHEFLFRLMTDLVISAVTRREGQAGLEERKAQVKALQITRGNILRDEKLEKALSDRFLLEEFEKSVSMADKPVAMKLALRVAELLNLNNYTQRIISRLEGLPDREAVSANDVSISRALAAAA